MNSRKELKNQARKTSDSGVQRILCPKYLVIGVELDKFITFARRLRLPVSRQLIKERAMMIGLTNVIEDYNSIIGYIEKFIRRNNINRSVRLHGRGGTSLPSNYEQRMEEIRSIANAYSLYII